MRQRFNLDVCIRPCQSFAGNPLNFIRRSADGGFEEPKVDAVIFRQNTEGLYCGHRVDQPADKVRDGLAEHPKWGPFADAPREELAMSVRAVHQEGLPAHRARRLRVRQEARLQVGDHLREAQRAARDLRHDGGGRP
jgi:hypothetical protein